MNRTLIAIVSLLQGLRGKSSVSASNIHDKIGNTRSEQRENLEVDIRTVVAFLRLEDDCLISLWLSLRRNWLRSSRFLWCSRRRVKAKMRGSNSQRLLCPNTHLPAPNSGKTPGRGAVVDSAVQVLHGGEHPSQALTLQPVS